MDSLPTCFFKDQLPVELGMDKNIDSWFTAVDKYGDYIALGGEYGNKVIIGLYNKKSNMNRFMWLKAIDYESP